jgi:hypothetical protein
MSGGAASVQRCTQDGLWNIYHTSPAVVALGPPLSPVRRGATPGRDQSSSLAYGAEHDSFKPMTQESTPQKTQIPPDLVVKFQTIDIVEVI